MTFRWLANKYKYTYYLLFCHLDVLLNFLTQSLKVLTRDVRNKNQTPTDLFKSRYLNKRGMKMHLKWAEHAAQTAL